MNLIDTHAHLTFDNYADSLPDVLQRSKDAGVNRWITVGTDLIDSENAVNLARRHENLYAAIGIHPHEAAAVTDEHISRLRSLAQHPRVVAIGETGLDYHYNYSEPLAQQKVFKHHIELSLALDLPLIIHSREAFEQTIRILESQTALPSRIVFHCFSGSAEQARTLVDKGFYLSFTGVVTFKNAQSVRRAAAAVPANRIMVETDCPFMSPAPMRKHKTNEPALMVHTARRLAELHQMDETEFADLTTRTAEDFFGLH